MVTQEEHAISIASNIPLNFCLQDQRIYIHKSYFNYRVRRVVETDNASDLPRCEISL